MIRTLFRVLLRSFVLLLALSGAAAAQSGRPALRATVTVDSDIVRIGDLVEDAGPVANIPIFRAPDLGTTGAVSTASIVEAIRPHQLIDIDTRGLAQVIVTRASRAIGPQEISDTITQALSQRFGVGEPRNLSLIFDLPLHTLQVEARASGDLQVLALTYDPRSGRFDVTLDLPSSSVLESSPARFTGSAVETIEAVTVNRPIERGVVLQAADLTVLRRPKAQATGLLDMNGSIGLAARHPLRPGQAITAADLMKPEVVAHNDTVTLVYEVPGLTLTLRGQAQDAGAVGDTIGVLNTQTKRVVQGVITGPGRVIVPDMSVHLAANTPEPAQPSAVAEVPEGQE
jgi:flagellar basal body P-ring formation protein FlgA